MLLDYTQQDTKLSGCQSTYDVQSQCVNGDAFQDTTDVCVQQKKSQSCFHLILFGRTEMGSSVAFDVDFWPCLWVDVPVDWTPSMARLLVDKLKTTYRVPADVIRWDLRHCHPTAGFFPDRDSVEPKIGTRPFVVIWTSSMAYFYSVKHFFENQSVLIPQVGPTPRQYTCFETNIPPILQFIDACKANPCSILKIKTSATRRPNRRFSHCDLEYACTVRPFDDGDTPFEPVPSDDIYPVTVLSFDIECRSKVGRFPDAKEPDNQIISICATARNMKTDDSISGVFGLNAYDEIPDTGKTIQSWFDSESDLIEAFRDFVVLVADPDIITGYNIHNFDWPYINDRLNLMGSDLSRFWYLSRLVRHRCQMETKEFSSKAYGASVSRQFSFPGRVDMDLYTHIKRNYKYRSYKLGYVAQQLLHNDKIDLPIAEMNECHDSGVPARRTRVHEYCLKDTWLPLEIWRTQYILEGMAEMARVTYTFLRDLFERGQSFKVLCQLYIFAHSRNYVLNELPDFSSLDTYKGATVLDMKRGFMKDVVVLDFAALYPSIMQALNLCYTSWVRDDQFKDLPGWRYYTAKTDIGTFTFQQTIEGLLPKMAASLGEQRKRAKAQMKDAQTSGDVAKKIIFNARQLALKVSTNSIYGFTGAAKMGKYPCPPIAATTTCYGRFLIAETKRMIEETYQEHGAECVYGDTDSTMVVFNNIPHTEAGYHQVYELGEAAAGLISRSFHPAIVLENEKVYRKVIMLKKKHYVAKSQEHPTEPQKMDIKGVMMVRRDFCDYQQQLYSDVINHLIDDESPKHALMALEAQFKRLVHNEVPLVDLTLSRQLAKEYANPNIVQKVVADRVNARNPGAGPMPGDRVEFVPIVGKGALYEHVEDVDYVRLHNIQVDWAYYIDSFRNSLGDLFDAFGHQAELHILVASYTRIARGHRTQSVLDFCPRSSTSPPADEVGQIMERKTQHRESFGGGSSNPQSVLNFYPGAQPVDATHKRPPPAKRKTPQDKQQRSANAKHVFAQAFGIQFPG